MALLELDEAVVLLVSLREEGTFVELGCELEFGLGFVTATFTVALMEEDSTNNVVGESEDSPDCTEVGCSLLDLTVSEFGLLIAG